MLNPLIECQPQRRSVFQRDSSYSCEMYSQSAGSIHKISRHYSHPALAGYREG